MSWERAYVAVSVMLGEPVDVALGALDEPGKARTLELTRVVLGSDRGARARGIAAVLALVAQDLDAMGFE